MIAVPAQPPVPGTSCKQVRLKKGLIGFQSGDGRKSRPLGFGTKICGDTGTLTYELLKLAGKQGDASLVVVNCLLRINPRRVSQLTLSLLQICRQIREQTADTFQPLRKRRKVTVDDIRDATCYHLSRIVIGE